MTGMLGQVDQEKRVTVLDQSIHENVRCIEDILGSAFLVDKPSGCTSYDIIRRVKRYFPRSTKIGHTGTLDPLATGLLILLFGKATKAQLRFLSLPKTYLGTIRLGETTASMDSETEVLKRKKTDQLSEEQIEAACTAYKGVIEQIPPMYSAIKVNGERLYKKARRGESIQCRPNTVTIHSFEVLCIKDADVNFRVQCSKGTYVRVLAHDVGQRLGVGGHLTRLRRTAIGDYQVDRALKIEALIAILRSL